MCLYQTEQVLKKVDSCIARDRIHTDLPRSHAGRSQLL